MAPVQGSKFAVLASPDEDEKKKSSAVGGGGSAQQQQKNAKKKAKKQLAKQMEETVAAVSKPQPKTSPTKSSPTSKQPLTSSSAASSSSSSSPRPSSSSSSASPSSSTLSSVAAEKKKKLLADATQKSSCPMSSKSTDSPTTSSLSTTKPPGSTVQSVFLWAVSACYLFAFVSFYYQIRGLYGDEGVLPLRHLVASLTPKQNQSITPEELYASSNGSPSIVWLLSGRLHFSLTSALELVTLFGALLSTLQLFFAVFRVAPNYLVLYFLYCSLTAVGQTFTAVLTALASVRGRLAPDARLLLWPARWLLFKLMFSSGVVKLTSRCPLWWSLRALDVHFESQCLPTPLAWYAHHLPANWLHLATALTYLVEILGPFLFFVPLRSARRFSFITQVAFQLLIIATGNYTFFNLLTLTLCISLLECPSGDSASAVSGCPAATKNCSSAQKSCRFGLATRGVFFGLVGYLLVHYFAVSLEGVTSVGEFFTRGPASKVNFTLEDFSVFLGQAIVGAMWLGALSLLHVSVRAIAYALTSSRCIFARSGRLLTTLAAIALCAAALTISTVPLAELDTSGASLRALPAPIQRWYGLAHQRQLVSGYGLFRVMTGGDGPGRPELIIEGNNDPNGESWRPYHFKYKPGDLKTAPRFNVPHQPRLDWQMWFAALGTYQGNPWLLGLAYRLLTASPDVLHLLDTSRLPFPIDSPPKYLRISRYLYQYTGTTESGWWKQTTNRHAYMPLVNKDSLAGALKLDEIVAPLWVQRLPALEAREHPSVKAALDLLHEAAVRQGASRWGLEPQHLMLLIVALAFLYQWSRCTHGSKKSIEGSSACPMAKKSSA